MIWKIHLRRNRDIGFSRTKVKRFNLNDATLADIMTLDEMEKDLAIEIYDYIKDNIITDASDLLELESIDKHMIARWNKNFKDMRFNINKADNRSLKKIKGINRKLAKLILDKKNRIREFKSSDELLNIYGISKNKICELRGRFKIEISPEMNIFIPVSKDNRLVSSTV
jgi:DNA uptake protein ComE-like DNA-binding protein